MTDSLPSRLPPRQQQVAQQKWPLVGEQSPRLSTSPWTLTIQGLVGQSVTWTLDDLLDLPSTTRTLDIHCVTRWSKFDVMCTGVRLLDLIDRSQPQEGVRFVNFIARSTRSHSTSLAWDDLPALDPLVVWQVDGQPLATEHGGPLRLITPGRYFYKSLKWLEVIELLADDRLGYWERDAGYHNHADPWKEERYIAGKLTKQQAAKLIESRDFRDQDLLGFQGSARLLDGLLASGAQMRDADFSGASLVAADFTDANLSNANFRDCDLTEAKFINADVEGADFGGAKLSGARFDKASLFGASFIDPPESNQRAIAQFSQSHQLSAEQLGMLTDEQQAWVRAALAQCPAS